MNRKISNKMAMFSMLIFAVLACEGSKMKGADTEKKAAPPKKSITEAASSEEKDKKADSLDALASDPNAATEAGKEAGVAGDKASGL